MSNLSIIIINYNTFETTCKCLDSFYAYEPKVAYEIILVDNASTECNPDLFKEKYPSITLVKSASNIGFAGGNNLGLNYATGSFILLLNSDTIFIEDCITPCVDFMNLNPQIGVVNPKLLNPDLSYQKNARRFKNITRELFDFFRPIIKFFPYSFYSKYFLNQYFKGDYNVSCDWLSGAFFLTKREVINKFKDKKLDDRFFMYGEDVFWSYQISQMGYTCTFLCASNIIHIGNVSTNKEKQMKLDRILIERETWFYNYRNKCKVRSFLFKILLNFKSFLIKNHYKIN